MRFASGAPGSRPWSVERRLPSSRRRRRHDRADCTNGRQPINLVVLPDRQRPGRSRSLDTRRAVSDRAAPSFALAATLCALAAGWAAPARGASVVQCPPLTVPVSVTKTIPISYTDVTVSGVSCTYAEKVFLIDTSKAGSAPPPGWNIRVGSGEGSTIEGTCRRGRELISFRLVRKS